jgi:peptidoglycan/LPS O-acetylase OafA/YrhL
LRYRAEIDGLRAVAVVPVILFHAGFEFFGGGFVGVDVFFVISGFLITSIILADMDAGRFGLANFYERRARRILPALFFMMAVCVPVAWLLLTPRDLRDFAQSIIAVSTFSSNILFWRESGYFDTAAELKPMLHTWSLAVEEQYYIFFPLFLMLVWRAGKFWVLATLLMAFVLSIGIGQWGAYNSPVAAFYLLPTRGWEILLGAFIALYLGRREPHVFSPAINQALSLVGLLLIAYSVVVFNERTPFPSFYTLVPTIGTGLILLCAIDGTVTNRILCNRVIVGVGLVSYSAYLYHQPIFVFTRYFTQSPLETGLLFSLFAVTFAAAFVSWRYIEKPFRNRQLVSRKVIFAGSGVIAASFIGIGVIAQLVFVEPTSIKIAGETIRIPKKFGGIFLDGRNCSFPKFENDDVCVINGSPSKGNLKIVVIGDSHARVLTEAFFERRDLYAEFVDLSASGCPFFLGLAVYVGDDAHGCTAKYQQRRLEFLKQYSDENTVVVLAARWPLYYYGGGFDNGVGGVEVREEIVAARTPFSQKDLRQADYYTSLSSTIDAVQKLSKHVVLVLPSHSNGWHPVDRALRIAKSVDNADDLFEQLQIPLQEVRARNQKFDEFALKNNELKDGLLIVNPREFTCDSEQTVCFGGRNGEFFFTDSHHLSPLINRQIVSEIEKILNANDQTSAMRHSAKER